MTIDHRSLSDQEQTYAKAVLQRTEIAYLAPSGDEPYVVPINYVYDSASDADGWGPIFFHSGEGTKSMAMERDPRVCLAILGEASFERGESPCDDGYAYQSVLVQGRARLLTEQVERTKALRAIVAKYDPEGVDRPFNDRVFERTLIYRVAVDSVSFKQRPRPS